MQIDNETLDALLEMLSTVKLAREKFSDLPMSALMICGCMGPLPECRCMKRDRLIDEFVTAAQQYLQVHAPEDPPAQA